MNDVLEKATISEGNWFRISISVIEKNRDKIHYECSKEGDEGKELWERFKKSNKIALNNSKMYPELIETYIFPRDWSYKTEKEMRNMCKKIGDGMCDEVICDLELQMRICKGESANSLLKNADNLPHVRVIKLRNGESGYFGGGVKDGIICSPADLFRSSYFKENINSAYTPYAFRRVRK